MPETVLCKKLKRDLEGFDKPPWPGEIGQRIMNEISREAWAEWLEAAKMIINENRLNLATPEAQKIIVEQMEAFLFSDADVQLPPDYVPPSDD